MSAVHAVKNDDGENKSPIQPVLICKKNTCMSAVIIKKKNVNNNKKLCTFTWMNTNYDKTSEFLLSFKPPQTIRLAHTV